VVNAVLVRQPNHAPLPGLPVEELGAYELRAVWSHRLVQRHTSSIVTWRCNGEEVCSVSLQLAGRQMTISYEQPEQLPRCESDGSAHHDEANRIDFYYRAAFSMPYLPSIEVSKSKGQPCI
jgi:hypothetical protein